MVHYFINEFVHSYSNLVLPVSRHNEVKRSVNSDDDLTDASSASLLRQAAGTAGCGGVVTLSDENFQTITTPNYPQSYPINSRCVWTVIAQIGTDYDQVMMEVTDFDLETYQCSDSLQVKDNTLGVTTTFCGNQYQKTVTSKGNSMMLTFASDGTVSKRGFSIKFSGIKSTCGVVERTSGEDSLYFSTPNYPQIYPVGTRCHWLVISEKEVVVKMVKYYSHPTNQDSVLISSGSFGNYEPYDPQKEYFSKIISVTFDSDSGSQRMSTEPGLQIQLLPLTLTNVCNQTLTVSANSAALLKSSKYPKGYDPSSNCEWTINYNINNSFTANLKFIDFDIEEDFECAYDRFEIFDPSLDTRETLCGEQVGYKYRTDSAELKLFFTSDSYNIFLHRGFSVLASAERTRRDECIVQKPDDNTWIIKSPDYSLISPTVSLCNIDISNYVADRFSVLFRKFKLQKEDPCKQGSFLSIKDKKIKEKEIFCGEIESYAFLTAGNDLKLFFSSISENKEEGFEIEIKSVYNSYCGENYKLNPGDKVTLEVPANVKMVQDCVWVLQGKKSVIILDFERVEDVRVSQTGLFSGLYSYNSRTLQFIEPSEKYMILTKDNSANIQAAAFAMFSDCRIKVELENEPVILTNSGIRYCTQTVTIAESFLRATRHTLAIRYSLISFTSSTSCALEVIDRDEGKVKKLCTDNLKQKYTTVSRQLDINSTPPADLAKHKFMVLVELVTYTCRKTFNVQDKVILKNKALKRKSTCIYRFTSNGPRMVLDVATGKKKALGYISVSTDGSFHSLKALSSENGATVKTNKEFLVLIRPLPKDVNFMLQVANVNNRMTSACVTCLTLQPGSEGLLTSPNTPDLTTYPAGLSCKVKFEAEHQNRTVILDFQQLHLPTNTAVDSLSIHKNGTTNIIEPSKKLYFPFIIETPFSIDFKTSSNNQYEGYKIHYKVSDCGGNIILNDETVTKIKSPGYKLFNSFYPTYIQCVWNIHANVSNISDRIRLTLKNFDIHESDTFEVFDPLYSTTPVANASGSEDSLRVVSTGNELRVVFKSDSRYVSSGFMFLVKAIVTECGQDIDTSIVEEGTVTTLDYFPNTKYCLFRFRPSQGRLISLTPLTNTVNRQGQEQPTQNHKSHQTLEAEECLEESVILSTTGLLSDGHIYCLGSSLPFVQSTQDILMLIRSQPIPPVAFSFRVGGCGGRLTSSNISSGQLTSPNYPSVYNGPFTCTWTSSGSLLINMTHLDLDVNLDTLTLTDYFSARTLTGTHYPHYMLLAGPSTITFAAGSMGVKTGFRLEYESVSIVDLLSLDAGETAVIFGWQGMQLEPSVWQLRTLLTTVQVMTVRVWAAYVPRDGPNNNCNTNFLLITDGTNQEHRVCGAAAFRTFSFLSDQVLLVLHASSPLAMFAASVHVGG